MEKNYSAAVDQEAKSKFKQVLDEHRGYLKSDVFEQLMSGFEDVEGSNKGNTSTVTCKAKNGPGASKPKLKIINNHPKSVMRHELGHILMDSMGFDGTQEATTRANNKNDYSQWPRFSFGKKDSPVERFLFRRYGDLDDITRHDVDDLEELGERSDIFVVDGEYYEANTYRYSADHWKRFAYHSAFVDNDPSTDTPSEKFKLRNISNRHDTTTFGPAGELNCSDVQVIDRYELTPGLATILGEEEPEWSDPMHELLYQINMHWYDAITLVRCRGEKRERGMEKAPRGKAKSYYVMNTHEYFAELHAVMIGNDFGHIDRLKTACPGLVEAYREAVMGY